MKEHFVGNAERREAAEREARARIADTKDAVIAEQSVLPTVNDPRLWMVKCRSGQEQAVTIQIMRRFLDRQGSEQV